ncbi:helix-turn-helix domain-containing protein [Paenibacillus sp. FSL H7-0350]|uniref:helix-turn-helix domain-containing protein n=1 Tax=Paenibacillus sp. FSL H7-0350 TaxID=2975345 RepID=UPI0031587E86
MNDINLNDETILTLSEAAQKWDISVSRVRQKIKDFPSGTARKFRSQWIVLEVGKKRLMSTTKTLNAGCLYWINLM